MTADITTRLAALAAGNAPPRRGHVLTPEQIEAVRDVIAVVGQRIMRRQGDEQPLTAPASLIGVLP